MYNNIEILSTFNIHNRFKYCILRLNQARRIIQIISNIGWETDCVRPINFDRCILSSGSSIVHNMFVFILRN